MVKCVDNPKHGGPFIDYGGVHLCVACASKRGRTQSAEQGASVTLTERWTGGAKFDTDKPRFELLDAETLEEVAKVMTFGAKKYAAHNWRKGLEVSRLIGAALRHTFSILRGEDKDPETGLHHAAHAICCLMFVFWTLKHRPDLDDRYKGETA